MAKSKNDKRTNIIVVVSIIVIIAVVSLGAVIYGHNKKIEQNPPGTMGNTSGNLNNMGYFCENDGLIYFANSEDNYYLYELDPMTMIARLVVEVPVAYINSAGDYIYFYYNDQGDAKFMGVAGNMRGVYRAKKDSSDAPTCLDRSTSGIIALLDNNIYYQHYDNTDGMTLYSVATDGSNKEQVAKAIVNPSCIISNRIYYPDQDNGFCLNTFDPETKICEMFAPERMYNPTVSGNYIFYMNVSDNYSLYRYDLSSHINAKLTNERIDTFNVYGSTVFLQTSSKKNPCLMRISADGTQQEIIAEGIYTEINCTSDYTFFRAFDNQNLFYFVPTQYGTQISEFHPFVEEK